MRLIALDVHQDNIVTAVLDYGSQNRPLLSRRYGLEEASLAEFTRELGKEDIVMMESTFNAFWLYHHIAPLVRSCQVLNLNAVHLRGNKTDKLDARKLLEVLSTFVVTDTGNGNLNYPLDGN